MNKTMVVAGIPGIGKTTVCDLVRKLAKDSGLEVTVLNYGTVTVETLQNSGEALGRDLLRMADMDFQRKLQRDVAEIISDRMRQLRGLTIIDTHMAIRTPSGYLPGMPSHVVQLLKPDMLVLIEAEPGEVSSRRMRDASRKRDDSKEEIVKEELLVSRLMAGADAVLTGAPLKIIVNAEGRPEEAAEEILKIQGAT